MMLYLFCLKDSVPNKHDTHKEKKKIAGSELSTIWSQSCAICSRMILSWVVLRLDQIIHCGSFQPQPSYDSVNLLKRFEAPELSYTWWVLEFMFISQYRKCISVPGLGFCEQVRVGWWRSSCQPSLPWCRCGWISAMALGPRGAGEHFLPGQQAVSSQKFSTGRELTAPSVPKKPQLCSPLKRLKFVHPGAVQNRSENAAWAATFTMHELTCTTALPAFLG